MAKELSQKEIQEIRSLRGKMTQAEIRKKFGIGTGRLYKIWNSGEENSDRAVLGASGPTDVAVLQALGRIEKQMGRLLKAQEGHYENVEELEGAVEQIAEAGTNILDGLEKGSQQVRATAENCAAAASAGKNVLWSLVGLGALALSFWLLFLLPAPKGAKAQSRDSTGPKAAAPAPDRPKSGIRAME